MSTTGPVAKTISYDAAGNTTADGAHTYAYDDRGRLVSIDSGSVSYAHNGLVQRVKKDDGSNTTLFVYDEAGHLIGEYNDSGTLIKEHVWFSGAPVAVLTSSNEYYVHTDHLGTPRIVSDGNTAIWRWESGPFGEEAAHEDPDGDMTNFGYNLRFPGQYYDAETGHHYNYFRTYVPSTGRYLESDPIGLDGGLNTYVYVRSNPVGLADPQGLVGWKGSAVITGPISHSHRGTVEFELTSDCVNNVEVFVKLRGTVTVGYMFGYNWTDIFQIGLELRDPFPVPSVTNLHSTGNNSFTMIFGAISIPPPAPWGYAYNATRVGFAHGTKRMGGLLGGAVIPYGDIHGTTKILDEEERCCAD